MNHLKSSLVVAHIAQNVMKKIADKPDYLEIFSSWKGIVGEYTASICVPHKAINIGKEKTLVLKTIKGRGLQIQHEALKILSSINKFLRKKTFSQIRVIQTESTGF
jgi:hypothetical protein